MKEFTEELKAGKDQAINYSATSGYVITEILNFTKKHSYDLIILGVNSGDTNNPPGSNTAEIIRNAGFPVMVIPGAGNASGDSVTYTPTDSKLSLKKSRCKRGNSSFNPKSPLYLKRPSRTQGEIDSNLPMK